MSRAGSGASTLTAIDVHFVPMRSSSRRVGHAGSNKSPRFGRAVTWTSPPVDSLTELGLSLEIPLAALRAWAEEHMAEIDDAG